MGKRFAWRRVAFAFSLVLYSLVFTSCGTGDLTNSGTGAGNPGSGATVSLQVEGVQLTNTNALVLSSGVEITTAQIVLSQIEFRTVEECQNGSSGGSSQVDLEGPYVIDLLNNTSSPSLDNINLKEGLYCRIELRLDKLEDNELPNNIDITDPIVSHSIYIEGKTGEGISFTAVLEIDDDFRLQNQSTGFNISNGDLLFVIFNLNTWFQGINFSDATVSGGEIQINKDENETIQQTLVSNIKLSSNLLRDENNNGELDSSEENLNNNDLAEGD